MATEKKNKVNMKEAAQVGAGVGLGAIVGQALKNYLMGETIPALGKNASASAIWAQEALRKANEAQAAANRAKVGAALGSKVGTAAGLGMVGGAGLMGALAIKNAKDKFDKEVDEGTAQTMAGWDSIIDAIKNKHKMKAMPKMEKMPAKPGQKREFKKLPYGGGASPELVRDSINLSQGANYIGGGASPQLTDLSKELYNRKTK